VKILSLDNMIVITQKYHDFFTEETLFGIFEKAVQSEDDSYILDMLEIIKLHNLVEQSKDKLTAVFEKAIEKDNIDLVNYFINNFDSIHAKDGKYLLKAFKLKHKYIALALLNAKFDCNIMDENGNNLLQLTLQNRQTWDIFKNILLDRLDRELLLKSNNEDKNVIDTAIEENDSIFALKLLKILEPSNIKEEYLELIFQNDNLELLKYYEEKIPQNTLQDFLYKAIKYKKEYIKNYLLVKLSNLKEKLLFLAVAMDDFSTLKYLLEKKNLDKNAIGKYGDPLIMYSIKIRRKKILNYLIDIDSNINVNDKEKQDSLLMLVIKEQWEILANSLINKDGIILNHKNIDGNSALFYAARYLPNLIDVLIKKGIKISEINNSKETALHYYLRHLQSDTSTDENIIIKFLEYGVDINQKDKFNTSTYNLLKKKSRIFNKSYISKNIVLLKLFITQQIVDDSILLAFIDDISISKTKLKMMQYLLDNRKNKEAIFHKYIHLIMEIR
jgi:hypothetical protein